MKSFLIYLGLFVSLNSNAEVREHAAHKHGSAEMSLAFEGAQGEIDFAVPSESIYGFEYNPKTAADKKKQKDGLELLEKNISSMVQFDDSLKCVISKEKIEIMQHKGENHAAIDAEFKILCQKSPVGSTIVFNIQKTFPRVKELVVKVIADDIQKSVEATSNGVRLELKK